jgi:hypothetical protein
MLYSIRGWTKIRTVLADQSVMEDFTEYILGQLQTVQEPTNDPSPEKLTIQLCSFVDVTTKLKEENRPRSSKGVPFSLLRKRRIKEVQDVAIVQVGTSKSRSRALDVWRAALRGDLLH